MLFLAEIALFGIYLAQQAGVYLAVGAQTILLAAHLVDVHKAHFNETFRQTCRAVREVGLVLIVLSGLGAVYFHYTQDTLAVLQAPSFIFKWWLAGLLVVLHVGDLVKHGRSAVLWLEGGSWYALFILHLLAPAVSWAYVLAAYGSWMAVFGLGWTLFVLLVRPPRLRVVNAVVEEPEKKPEPVPVPAPVVSKPAPPPVIPKPVAPPAPVVVAPPPMPKPVVAATPPPPPPKPVPTPAPAVRPLPTVHSAGELPAGQTQNAGILQKTSAPTTPVAEATVKDVEEEPPAIPALHVMPKTPEDIGKHWRNAVVRFAAE